MNVGRFDGLDGRGIMKLVSGCFCFLSVRSKAEGEQKGVLQV